MRLGVIGYHINSGIGSLIDDLKAQLPVLSHFVVPQQKQGIDANKASCCPLVFPSAARNQQLADWVAGLDTVICAEFLPHDDVMPALCKRAGVKLVCIVDIDWFDPKCSWASCIDTFICPNTYTAQQMHVYGFKNAVMIPGCVDTDYFEFKPRDLCGEFLFNNGWGGYRRRKGLDIVERASQIACAPVYINSQAPVSTALPGITVNAANLPDRKSLFTRGQVYLAPTRCEGYGLHILEAMACGYPVITTAGKPMTDYVLDSAFQIKTSSVKQIREARFSALWCEPDAQSLAAIMTRVYDTSIRSVSHEIRSRIESMHSWDANRDAYLQVLE